MSGVSLSTGPFQPHHKHAAELSSTVARRSGSASAIWAMVAASRDNSAPLCGDMRGHAEVPPSTVAARLRKTAAEQSKFHGVLERMIFVHDPTPPVQFIQGSS